jgi:hypothetical protein
MSDLYPIAKGFLYEEFQEYKYKQLFIYDFYPIPSRESFAQEIIHSSLKEIENTLQ